MICVFLAIGSPATRTDSSPDLYFTIRHPDSHCEVRV